MIRVHLSKSKALDLDKAVTADSDDRFLTLKAGDGQVVAQFRWSEIIGYSITDEDADKVLVLQFSDGTPALPPQPERRHLGMMSQGKAAQARSEKPKTPRVEPAGVGCEGVSGSAEGAAPLPGSLRGSPLRNNPSLGRSR